MSNASDKQAGEETEVHHRDDATRYFVVGNPSSDDFNHDIDQLQRFLESRQKQSDSEHATDNLGSDFIGLVVFGLIVLPILILIAVAVFRYVGMQL